MLMWSERKIAFKCTNRMPISPSKRAQPKPSKSTDKKKKPETASKKRKTTKGGSTPDTGDVVGRGAPIDVGLPMRPQNASTDWFTASATQHAVANEPFHVMNYINRGIVYPNVPIYDNPKVFGGGSRKTKSVAVVAPKGRSKKPAK
jgi:hypothetical protein